MEGERRAAREVMEGEGGKAEGAAGEVPEGEARYFQMEIVGGCRVMSYEHNDAVS